MVPSSSVWLNGDTQKKWEGGERKSKIIAYWCGNWHARLLGTTNSIPEKTYNPLKEDLTSILINTYQAIICNPLRYLEAELQNTG